MKESTKDFLAFMVIVLAIIVALSTVLVTINLVTDTEDWDQTEDPACYLHTVNDNRLTGDDTVTRTRYCEVES